MEYYDNPNYLIRRLKKQKAFDAVVRLFYSEVELGAEIYEITTDNIILSVEPLLNKND